MVQETGLEFRIFPFGISFFLEFPSFLSSHMEQETGLEFGIFPLEFLSFWNFSFSLIPYGISNRFGIWIFLFFGIFLLFFLWNFPPFLSFRFSLSLYKRNRNRTQSFKHSLYLISALYHYHRTQRSRKYQLSSL